MPISLSKLTPEKIAAKALKESRRLAAQLWRHDIDIADCNGLRWLLNRKNRVDRKVICGGYEREQFAYLAGKMKERGCDVFLDIGANFGLYAVQVAAAGLAEKVHAFEPDPRNHAQLQANTYLNGLAARISCHPVALSDRAGRVTFELYPQKSTGQSRVQMAPSQEAGVETISVAAARLDDILPLQGQRLFMKIDVEGHEKEMLQGAGNILRGNDCFLQIEAWPGKELALEEQMRGMGYRRLNVISQDHYYAKE